MNKADLKRNLETELLKIEREDKIYGVGETRYDLMIKDVLNYIDNSISKKEIEEKIEELNKDIEDYLKTDKSGRFTRTNCIFTYKKEVLQELLEGK